MTDLERLWKVVSGELQGRAVGKTTAACHDVAGAILTGSSRIVVVETKHHRDIPVYVDILERVLDEYGMRLSRKGSTTDFYVEGKELRFMASTTYKNWLHGAPEHNYVCFVDY